MSSKISGLPALAQITPATIIPVVLNGQNFQITVAQLIAAIGGTATPVPVDGALDGSTADGTGRLISTGIL